MIYRQINLDEVSRLIPRRIREPMKEKHPKIYMDYQASTPIDKRVIEEMQSCYSFFGNPHASEHSFGWDSFASVERATSELSAVLNVDKDEIIFTSGATESNNLAILGVAENAPISRKKILVSSIEHACVISSARAAEKRYGCTVEILPVDERGIVDLDYLSQAVGDDTLLVSVMAVNNEIGTIQPIEEIGNICNKVGTYFHTDATHKLGTGGFDASVADMVSLSSHKIYGPKGIGVLYIRRPIQKNITPMIYGGGQQNGLRSGTVPLPLCAGMARACSIMVAENSGEERKRIKLLRDTFVSGILAINQNFYENGLSGHLRHPGNTNICFKGIDGRSLLSALQPNIAASTGSACHTGSMEPSHVLTSIGLSKSDANSSIRFGFGRFSTKSEVLSALDFIQDKIAQLD